MANPVTDHGFGFYKDANLTQPYDDNGVTLNFYVTPNQGDTKEYVVYFGSPDENYKAVDAEGQGIYVQIIDNDPNNSHEIGDDDGKSKWKIVIGDENPDNVQWNTARSLGTEILGGTSNAIKLRIIRYEPPRGEEATFNDFVLTTTSFYVMPRE